MFRDPGPLRFTLTCSTRQWPLGEDVSPGRLSLLLTLTLSVEAHYSLHTAVACFISVTLYDH